MKTILIIAVMVCVPALLFAQGTAQVSSSGSEVQAGDVVTFNISLDKPPSFDNAGVLVTIAPSSAQLRKSFRGVQNTGTIDQGRVSVSLRVPATAPEGQWSVTSVRLLVPGGPSVPLNVSASGFQVHSNPNLVLPSTATLELSK